MGEQRFIEFTQYNSECDHNVWSSGWFDAVRLVRGVRGARSHGRRLRPLCLLYYSAVRTAKLVWNVLQVSTKCCCAYICHFHVSSLFLIGEKMVIFLKCGFNLLNIYVNNYISYGH